MLVAAVLLNHDLAVGLDDDLGDGGAKDRVSVTRLKAKAKALAAKVE